MSINVTVHQHRKPLGNHREFSSWLRHHLPQFLSDAENLNINIYNMGISSNLIAGEQYNLVVLAHDTNRNGDNQPIKIGEEVVAYYYDYHDRVGHMLTIPEDIFSEFTDSSRARVKDIFTALNEQVFKVAKLRYSWKLTHDKDGLTKEFTTRIKQQQERYLNDDKHRVQSLEEDIRQYTKALKDKYDSRIRLLGNIETAMTRINAVQEKLIKDLDNIINHPKVVDLVIKDGKFIVTTAPLYMYHDRTGEKYFLGDMRIEMNPQNTEVRFYNISNRRKSYWSSQDNHPHVGENGGACLGNVGATIAELCSQMELYALTLVGIDFLESTNTSDPAGKNIVNWDKVDEEGNIVEPEPDWTCNHCGEGQSEHDDGYTVFTSYTGERNGTGEFGEERYVCGHCRDEHYTYHENLDEAVLDGEVTYTDEEEE